MNPRERLLAVLQRREVDRPPVICPGGMMNAALVEIMDGAAYALPRAHSDPELMARLAIAVHEKTGFENIGLPFCMTIEAEALGSPVNMGSLSCEPKIDKEAYPSVNDVPLGITEESTGSGLIPSRPTISGRRMGIVLEAISRVSKTKGDVPVTSVVTGPLSVAASTVDPVTFYKELRKNRDRAHAVMEHVTKTVIGFALMMGEAGADVITIADPSASGEILGPSLFEEYAVKYLNSVVDAIHGARRPVIVHICGDMNAVRHHLQSLRADAISLDSTMSLSRIKEEFPHLTTMGNVSTQLLASGTDEKIAGTAERLVREGVNIIAPACGLDTGTPLTSIRALTESVKAHGT